MSEFLVAIPCFAMTLSRCKTPDGLSYIYMGWMITSQRSELCTWISCDNNKACHTAAFTLCDSAGRQVACGDYPSWWVRLWHNIGLKSIAHYMPMFFGSMKLADRKLSDICPSVWEKEDALFLLITYTDCVYECKWLLSPLCVYWALSSPFHK